MAGYERHEAGLGYEATPCSDRDSIETRRVMSVEAGHDYEATCLSDRDSIETRRDMSVTKPAAFRATHDDDLDTRLDSRLPGYERHIRPGYEVNHGDDLDT